VSRFELTVTGAGVELRAPTESRAWFSKLKSRSTPSDLLRRSRDDEALLDAIAELRELGESGGADIELDRIGISHDVLSRVSDQAATALELPPTVDLVLKLEVDGQLGHRSFSLGTRWLDGGQPAVVRRNGAVLETERGTRRLPAPMLRAIREAERVSDGPTTLASHWERLATFRNALEPDATDPATLPDFAGRTMMSAFLEGLRLQACSALAIGAGETEGDFEPLPFARAPAADEGPATESEALLDAESLAAFRREFRERGATPAYRLGDGRFLILTPDVLPLARLMADKQRALEDERRDFVLNPEPFVREAYRSERPNLPDYDEAEEVMGAAEFEELEEATIDERLVVTIEYRDRVIGLGVYEAPDLAAFGGGAFSTTWLAEGIAQLAKVLAGATDHELDGFEASVEEALSGDRAGGDGASDVTIGGLSLPATEAGKAIQAERVGRAEGPEGKASDGSKKARRSDGTVLLTETNYEQVDWYPETIARGNAIGDAAVPNVATELMAHQRDSLDWAQRAWLHGLPGVLNADEQGLGKTLQTLAFLSWLHGRLGAAEQNERRPFLIVAPTSLLRTWEAEIERHLKPDSFAVIIRLYGPSLGVPRTASGTDIERGDVGLDLSFLREKIDEGRGHHRVLLTTYRTLANYHHSLHEIRFAALVFDEIQNLKNPATIAAAAARSICADFRIGLTGTPIENKVQDLWAIMDQLSPGAFGSLKDFSAEFGACDRPALEVLNERLLEASGARPAVAIRRVKEAVASDLPLKRRWMLPAAMPTAQVERYDEARLALVGSVAGGALKALHHIRSASTHPGLVDDDRNGELLIADSARVRLVVVMLDRIAALGERALVFVESRALQFRLAEALAARYDLPRVDVINGNTPIPARQRIVERFQGRQHESGFDVLVLGPRSAGTGLTLTAANHVLHVSRWWNPAVEEQCNDRVHRIGQRRDVNVYLPFAIHPTHVTGSFDCLLQRLMLAKRSLATDVLAPMADCHDDVNALQEQLLETVEGAIPVFASVSELDEWARGRWQDYRAAHGHESWHTTVAGPAVIVHLSSSLQDAGAEFRIGGDAGRTIVLGACGESRLMTECDDAGMLTTRLSGASLALWPEAVLEPTEAVRFSR